MHNKMTTTAALEGPISDIQNVKNENWLSPCLL
jgi:hypothetical protein